MNKFYSTDTGTLYNGDSLSVLKSLEDSSIDCVVTSPPYWALRKYDGMQDTVWGGRDNCNHDWDEENWCTVCNAFRGSLGNEYHYEIYLRNMMLICKEIKRVLKDTGTFFLNIGDTYSAGHMTGKYGPNSANKGKNYQADYGKLPSRSAASIGLQPKCLVGIPERLAIMLTDDGWVRRNTIIWHKISCMPQSVQDRFTVDFEPIYFFTKKPDYEFNQQFQPHKDVSIIRAQNPRLRSEGHPSKGIHQYAYKNEEYVLNDKGRNMRCVWHITSGSSPEAHFAVFPDKLIEPMIKAGSSVGGVVLDPFCGTGTTVKVAEMLGRKWVGIEISEKYCELIKRNVNRVSITKGLYKFKRKRKED